MSISQLMNQNKGDVAIIVGNGINLYGTKNSTNSWDELLKELAKEVSPHLKHSIPKGISMTEYYDIIDLSKEEVSPKFSLQEKFCEEMKSWAPGRQHLALVNWARLNGVPIMTTNFDNTLGKAGDLYLHRFKDKSYTDIYPWSSYYSNKEISDPTLEFAIWHIHGMEEHRRSIRLGLTHYMGCVHRARPWIHFVTNRATQWKGKWVPEHTWLQIIISKPLIFVGLTLDESEVFLRWLLIERAKYFNIHRHLTRQAWYISKGELARGKRLFLEAVGIGVVEVKSYDEIYSEPWI